MHELADDLQLITETARTADALEHYDRVVLERVQARIGCEVAFFVRHDRPGAVALGFLDSVRSATRTSGLGTRIARSRLPAARRRARCAIN